MNHKILSLLFSFNLFFCIESIDAKPWALGVSISPLPGISIQVKPPQNPRQAYHFGFHYSQGLVFQLNSDYQYFFSIPQSTGQTWTGFYSGMGIRGESYSETPYKEDFLIRLPLGLQWEHLPAHFQVFAEVVGLIGPLPNTKFFASGSLGARSYF